MASFADLIGDMTGKVVETQFKLGEFAKTLTSLEGSPKESFFYTITGCKKITSLKGCPERINGGDFGISELPKLTSLEYAPKYINRYMWAKNLPLIDDVRAEIIKYGIVAKGYYLDSGFVKFEDIKDEIEMNKNVKSKGFRALLGLKNDI